MCTFNFRFYQDQQEWTVGECTNCTCIRGKVECRTDDTCLQALRPTREPHIDDTYPISGGVLLKLCLI